MFDNLKDTLTQFKSDVDESATETASEGGEPTTEADAEPAQTEEDNTASVGLRQKASSLARGQIVIEADDLDGPLNDLKLALLEANVEYAVVESILETVREDLVGETRRIGSGHDGLLEDALQDALLDVLEVNQFDFLERIDTAEKPVTIIFTGVNGVGKTTTIAKLSQYLETHGFSTVMANGDTYRAGAEEQIQAHADALDTKLIAHEQGSDPAAVIYDAVEYADANDVDVVLGDTAGRLHTDDSLMEQLAKIDRVVGPDMSIFVDEAVAGQDAIHRAEEFAEATEIDGAILTMAEADDNGGAAISIAEVTGTPILFLGTGQEYADIEEFNPETLVSSLVGE